MAAYNQRQPPRRRLTMAAAALTLALALSAPHLALTAATASKTSAAASVAIVTQPTTSAQTSLAASSTTKAVTDASTTGTVKSTTTKTTTVATTQTTKAATTQTSVAATTSTTSAATTKVTNATTKPKTNAATTQTLPTTTKTINAATTPTTNAYMTTLQTTNAATTKTTTSKTNFTPTATTTPKVLTSSSGVVPEQTSPNPNFAVLPRSVVDGLTGGCVNTTGSRLRMSKKHTDAMVGALISFMKLTIRTDVFNQSYRPLIAGSVRLGFHSCANGTCGGCINVNNPANNGLNFTIEGLTEFLRQLRAFAPFADCDITYADLWQAAASAALQISLFDNSGTKFYVPIVFGRIDCPTAPFTNDTIAYPDRRDTIDKVLSFFKIRFGLTAREVVALVGGGHSLGVTRDLGTSAIKGQWDNSPDSSTVEFYTTLVNQVKVWLPTPINYTNIAHPIYSLSKSKGFIFLTPDFSLARNITLKNETTGEPACQLATCPFSSTYDDVVFFSRNVTDWAQTFATAYTRMTTAGYASGQLQAPI